MKNEDFEEILNNRIDEIRATLNNKAKEYASDIDRLYNFKESARLQQVTVKRAAFGIMSKQLVCVEDMIKSDKQFDNSYIDEKVGDLINYLILLEAILKEENGSFNESIFN